MIIRTRSLRVTEEFFADKPFIVIVIAKESVYEDNGLNTHNVLFFGKITNPSITKKVQHDEL